MPVEVKVPAVGESVTEVYIGQWHKREGDPVDVDERLVELESEKATFDVPASASGTLTKILKQPGETAAVGEVIAEIDETAPARRDREAGREAAAAAEQPRAAKPPAPRKRAARQPARQPTPEPPPAAPPREEPQPVVMPAARRLVAETSIDAAQVEGTGKGGRILKEDVQRAAAAQGKVLADITRLAARRAADREEEVVPMSPIRQQIARRLVAAQQNAALLTTFNEVDMSAVMALRERYREAFQQKYHVKLGFMSFFVKAVVEALQQFPQINAEVRDASIVYRNYYDIGIAIGGGRGLVVPVLRNAEQMSFAEIELAINDFARRAANNELRLEELRGGTFTISNGGVYGSLLSTPIINPPQSGVLGMHAIQQRPVVIGGQIVARPMMYLALTYDHRVVDGREAVTFLRRIRETIEEPARMLIEV